jgi:hypothetical protein
MLRRNVDDRTAFMLFTLWDSLEAVKAFAGDDYETAVFYPEDERFLVERDRTAAHYEVTTHVGPDVAAHRSVLAWFVPWARTLSTCPSNTANTPSSYRLVQAIIIRNSGA